MRVSRRFSCLCLLAFAGSPDARAGAFMQGEGEGQLISTSRFTSSLQAFDARGKLVPVDEYRKYELGYYIEYGAADWITLILQPTLSRIHKEGPPTGVFNGIGSVEAGARVLLTRRDDVVFSAQAIARVPGSRDRTNPALVGETDLQFDGRLLAGTSFEFAGKPFFADAQLGYRTRGGGPPNEIRVDLTLGARPFAPLSLMLQSFNIVAPGRGGAGFRSGRQHKLQASAAWDFSKAWTIQSGVFTTVASRNFRSERGLVTAVWYRF